MRTAQDRRIFKPKDFREASKIDRLYMHLLQPDDFTLNGHEQKHLERLRQVFALVGQEPSDAKAVALVEGAMPELSKSTIYRAIRDMKKLFGEITLRNREFDRQVLGEKLLALALKAEEKSNIKEARRCYQAYAKIWGLDRLDVENFNPQDLEIPQPIFTTREEAYFEDAEIVDDNDTQTGQAGLPE